MSEILIKGMSMPKSNLPYGAHIIIKPNGDVVDYLNGSVFAKAVALPPHGDLCDRDFIKNNGISLNDAPTVIPASEED